MGIAHGKNKNKWKIWNGNDTAVFSINTMDESQKNKPKNPMLLSPVIRCVLKFLNIEDIKKCRLVSREWGSIGKLVLTDRALIHFHCDIAKPIRRPVDFYSCFGNSATLFSAFKIYGFVIKKSNVNRGHWTIEELTKFFDKQQEYIKELTLNFEYIDEEMKKNMDLSSWISKSSLVQKDAKYLTKLNIQGRETPIDIPSLHLIAHIKDLLLYNCRIHVEAGIRICPVKLTLEFVKFLLDGIKLDSVRINDFVDFSKAKKVFLRSNFCETETNDKCVLDFRGNTTLENLSLESCSILNGETSYWDIENLVTIYIPYSLNSGMKIKELYLSSAGSIDLFTLPNSVEKLVFDGNDYTIICSRPIVLENLQFLYVINVNDFLFLSYFVNCPQLTQLILNHSKKMKIKSLWIPQSVKSVTIQNFELNWVDENCLHLQKLILHGWNSTKNAKVLCRARILVDDLFVRCLSLPSDEDLFDILQYRNISFVKRFYFGQLWWGDEQFHDSVLEKYVDIQSKFYFFENGVNGRALSEETFNDSYSKLLNLR